MLGTSSSSIQPISTAPMIAMSARKYPDAPPLSSGGSGLASTTLGCVLRCRSIGPKTCGSAPATAGLAALATSTVLVFARGA